MKMVPLGDLIAPARAVRAGSRNYPLLSMTMHNGLINQSMRFKKRIASTDTSPYKVVRRGQLVVGFPIDEGVLDIQTLHDEGMVSPAYEVWDITSTDVRPEHLKRFLKSPQALDYYRAKLQGSTARRRSLTRADFLDLRVPLPSLHQQRRIASILDRADALRTKRREQLALLDALPQAIFHEMFESTGLPMTTIGDLATDVQYGTSDKAYDEGAYPILRMGNITDLGALDLADLKYLDLAPGDVARYTTKRGDLLFNRTNSLQHVGKSAAVHTDESFAIAGYLIRVRFATAGLSDFVATFLNGPAGRATRRRVAKVAVNQANMSAGQMRQIALPRPSEDAVHRFAQRLAGIRLQRAQVLDSVQAFDALFASIQSRAFRGEP